MTQLLGMIKQEAPYILQFSHRKISLGLENRTSRSTYGLSSFLSQKFCFYDLASHIFWHLVAVQNDGTCDGAENVPFSMYDLRLYAQQLAQEPFDISAKQ